MAGEVFTPTILDYTQAQHDHGSPQGGGPLAAGIGGGSGGDIDGGSATSIYGGEIVVDCGTAIG